MSEARAPLIDESGVLPARASRDDVLARIAARPITGDTPEEMRRDARQNVIAEGTVGQHAALI